MKKASKPVFILNLKGEIVAGFESKLAASSWLGMENPTYLTKCIKDPSFLVRSLIDKHLYRVVEQEFFKDNLEHIKSWSHLYPDKYLRYNNEPMTISEIREIEGISHTEFLNRALKGKYELYSVGQ